MSLGKKMDLQNCVNETAALGYPSLPSLPSLQSYEFVWIKKESII